MCIRPHEARCGMEIAEATSSFFEEMKEIEKTSARLTEKKRTKKGDPHYRSSRSL